jgi:hypothetical protein
VRPRLQFGQQPRILVGDDGLIGEGLEQLDLGLRKCAGFAARHRDHAYRLGVP